MTVLASIQINIAHVYNRPSPTLPSWKLALDSKPYMPWQPEGGEMWIATEIGGRDGILEFFEKNKKEKVARGGMWYDSWSRGTSWGLCDAAGKTQVEKKKTKRPWIWLFCLKGADFKKDNIKKKQQEN